MNISETTNVSPQEESRPFGFRPGRRIGPYVIVAELGAGAQGRVFRARGGRPRREVALKVMPAGMGTSRAARHRFEMEAEVASKLNHPGLCTVFDMGEDDGLAWMAMQLIEGTTLSRRLRTAREATEAESFVDFAGDSDVTAVSGQRREPSTGPVSRHEIHAVVQLIERAARALHTAHEAGLVHRDVKPSNIMVRADGRPVILDFGLVRDDEVGPGVTATGDMLGTPAYMSPEQIVAQHSCVDRRTDVWSLGVTLYECLTLRRPFRGPNREALYQSILMRPPREIRRCNPSVPRDLSTIVGKALEKDADLRYASALDLAEDLRRFRQHEPILARGVGPVTKTVRWGQRNPVVATLLVTLFVLLVAALVWKQNQNAALKRESDRKDEALADVALMAGLQKLQKAEEEAAALWPARPVMIPALERWLDRYGSLSTTTAAHELKIAEIEAQAIPYSAADRQADHTALFLRIATLTARSERLEEELEENLPVRTTIRLENELEAVEDEIACLEEQTRERKTWRFVGGRSDLLAWKRAIFVELVRGLRRFSDPAHGTYRSVVDRLARAREIEHATVTVHRAAWDETRRRIATHKCYGGLEIPAQVGLIPLGPDPRSGLEEFLHWETHTGPLPERDPERGWKVTPETGIIFVLLPAGRFWMGAQSIQEGCRNFDPAARSDEVLRQVDVRESVLLSKYEMTQGQWSRLPIDDRNPSQFGSGYRRAFLKTPVDARHPVEMVSWNDCHEALPRVGLAVPGEVLWEYAARGGEGARWPGAATIDQVSHHGNVAGKETARHYPVPDRRVADGWIIHAPVGSFRPNAFGLFDMLGNLGEWTASEWKRSRGSRAEVQRITRGGSFYHGANAARTACRTPAIPTFRSMAVGVRPCRLLSR